MKLGLMGLSAIACVSLLTQSVTVALSSTIAPPVPVDSFAEIQNLAKRTAVRILTPYASGSGVIVARRGQIYTVLTNWHVIGFSDRHAILTADGQRYTPIPAQPRQLGVYDLALTEFRSSKTYEVAKMATHSIAVGETVFAAGFPMYNNNREQTTFDRGTKVFHLTQGKVSLLPQQPMAYGYRLGYTNDVVEGMSGGAIFNSKGFLIGVNGRLKYGEPSFGIYEFTDGTKPSPSLIEKMVDLSWGIPIQTYIQFFYRNELDK